MVIFQLFLSIGEMLLTLVTILVIALGIIYLFISSARKGERELDRLDSEAEMYCTMWYAKLVREAEKEYFSCIKKNDQERLPDVSDVFGKEIALMHQFDEAVSHSERKETIGKYVPDIILSLVRYKNEGFKDFSPREVTRINKMMRKYGV